MYRRDLPALNWQRLVPRARHPYSDLVTASLYHTRGDDRQALRVINEAIPQAKSLGDDELLVRLEVLAARVEESAGALARSFEYALTALDLWQNLDDQQQEIMCLRFIAGIYAKQGNLAKAKETLESARSLAGSCKNRYWEASLLDDLQASVSDQGQLEDGLAYARERGKIWRDLNRPNDSCRASRSAPDC